MGITELCMKLSEVLQKKKDLEEKKARLAEILRKENSIIKGNTRSNDLKAVYADLVATHAQINKLKAAIQIANIPINKLIYEHGSLTEEKKMWEGTKAIEGPLKLKNQETLTMEVVFTKAEIAKKTEQLDTKIKEIRDELTRFNNTTEVNIE